jgi:hypothetical protein
MSYQDKAEVTREFYRKQGEQRERERVIAYLKRLMEHQPGVSWSPKTLLTIIEQL